jgi:hypothetical protein
MRALVGFSGGAGVSGSVRAGDTFDVGTLQAVAWADEGRCEPVDPAEAVAEVEASGLHSPALDAFVQRGGVALERRSERFAEPAEPTSLAEVVGHRPAGIRGAFDAAFRRGRLR